MLLESSALQQVDLLQGSLLPGIGNIVGAIVGALLGVLSSIWGFFASEAKCVNRAKEKLQHTIDDQIDLVDEEVRNQFKKLGFEDKINESYEQISCQADRQKDMLNDIKKILNKVESELKASHRKIS